jgi:SIR2-like domain
MTQTAVQALSRDDLDGILKQLLADPDPPQYSFLIGAGFSRSAGVPTAEEVANILAAFKLQRLHGASIDRDGIIERFFQEDNTVRTALSRLAETLPEFKFLSYDQAYQQLFEDKAIFPSTSFSRSSFMDTLLRTAEEYRYGWNFESVYLGCLCDHFARLGKPFLNVILTTNFDNVLVNSFSLSGTRYRLLDHPAAILDDKLDSKYPRLVYLHGRYANYQLINSRAEIASLVDEVSTAPTAATRTSQRARALARSISLAAERGGLIVVGYEGWEDVVMTLLSRELENEGRFQSGIIWCLYGPLASARPAVLDLAKKFATRFSVVEGVSAIKVMQMALAASGLSEASVIHRAERESTTKNEDMRRRWVEIQHSSRGWRPLQRSVRVTVDQQFAMERIVRFCAQAFRDSKYAARCLMLIKRALEGDYQWSKDDLALLLWNRGELRRLSAVVDEALADFYAALELSADTSFRCLISLAEAYHQLGAEDALKALLIEAYRLARKSKSPIDLAHCRLLRAKVQFQANKLAQGKRSTMRAAAEFEKAGLLDMVARCQVLQASMEYFNNQPSQGLFLGLQAFTNARKSDSRKAEARSWFVQGMCLTELGDRENAEAALKNAQAIALESPEEGFLGELNSHLAEILVAKKEVVAAVKLLDEAAEVFTLCAWPTARLQVEVWRELVRLQVGEKIHPKTVADAVLAIRGFEKLGDHVLSASHWALLAFDLMSFPDRDEAKQCIDEAIEACGREAQKFMDAEHFARIDVRPKRKRSEMKESQMRLAAHVEEHLILANLLYGLLQVGGVTVREETMRADYLKFRGSVLVFQSASPRTRAISAVVGHHMRRLKLMNEGELVKFQEEKPTSQFDQVNVAAFCVQQGFWWFARLVG